MQFRAPNAVGYDLTMEGESRSNYGKFKATLSVGVLQVIWDLDAHINVRIIVVFECEQGPLPRPVFKEAIERLIVEHGFAAHSTYEARSFQAKTINYAENRIDINGISDGLA